MRKARGEQATQQYREIKMKQQAFPCVVEAYAAVNYPTAVRQSVSAPRQAPRNDFAKTELAGQRSVFRIKKQGGGGPALDNLGLFQTLQINQVKKPLKNFMDVLMPKDVQPTRKSRDKSPNPDTLIHTAQGSSEGRRRSILSCLSSHRLSTCRRKPAAPRSSVGGSSKKEKSPEQPLEVIDQTKSPRNEGKQLSSYFDQVQQLQTDIKRQQIMEESSHEASSSSLSKAIVPKYVAVHHKFS